MEKRTKGISVLLTVRKCLFCFLERYRDRCTPIGHSERRLGMTQENKSASSFGPSGLSPLFFGCTDPSFRTGEKRLYTQQSDPDVFTQR